MIETEHMRESESWLRRRRKATAAAAAVWGSDSDRSANFTKTGFLDFSLSLDDLNKNWSSVSQECMHTFLYTYILQNAHMVTNLRL